MIKYHYVIFSGALNDMNKPDFGLTCVGYGRLTAYRLELKLAGDRCTLNIAVTGRKNTSDTFCFVGAQAVSVELYHNAIVQLYLLCQRKCTQAAHRDDRVDAKTVLFYWDESNLMVSASQGEKHYEYKLDEGEVLDVVNICSRYLGARYSPTPIELVDKWLDQQQAVASPFLTDNSQTNNVSDKQTKALWAIYYKKWGEKSADVINYIIELNNPKVAEKIIGESKNDLFITLDDLYEKGNYEKI